MRLMRVKAEIWVKAYLRACAAQGVSGVVVHHGDDDAGAIFVKICWLDGTASLFGPAPAGAYEQSLDRQFIAVFDRDRSVEADVDSYITQQRAFDQDLWVIEIEDRRGRHFLDDWLIKQRPEL